MKKIHTIISTKENQREEYEQIIADLQNIQINRPPLVQQADANNTSPHTGLSHQSPNAQFHPSAQPTELIWFVVINSTLWISCVVIVCVQGYCWINLVGKKTRKFRIKYGERK